MQERDENGGEGGKVSWEKESRGMKEMEERDEEDGGEG